MDILDYTSYDEVRALLGVSSDELEDGTLALPVYATNLEAELRDIKVSLPTDYQSIHALTTRSAEQQWFYDIARFYAAHVVARQLCTSLPLFSPREISDGKANVVRFAQNPFQTTIDRIDDQYNVARRRLESAYAALPSASTATTTARRVFFSSASGATDPVTGA